MVIRHVLGKTGSAGFTIPSPPPGGGIPGRLKPRITQKYVRIDTWCKVYSNSRGNEALCTQRRGSAPVHPRYRRGRLYLNRGST
jgi:hypothetical protein